MSPKSAQIRVVGDGDALKLSEVLIQIHALN